MADVDTIMDLKRAMTDIGWEAEEQARHLERDRPYSSPPPAIHPVWSDELRAESARLREEGLLHSRAHPWEVRPQDWPSADPVAQALLLEGLTERLEWEALATEISDPMDEDMGLANTQGLALPDSGWGPLDVQTGIGYLTDYGHQPHPPVPVADRKWAAIETDIFRPGTPSEPQTWAGHLQQYGQRQTTFDGPDDVRIPAEHTPAELRAQALREQLGPGNLHQHAQAAHDAEIEDRMNDVHIPAENTPGELRAQVQARATALRHQLQGRHIRGSEEMSW